MEQKFRNNLKVPGNEVGFFFYLCCFGVARVSGGFGREDVRPAPAIGRDLDGGLRGIERVHKRPARAEEMFLDRLVVEGLANHLRGDEVRYSLARGRRHRRVVVVLAVANQGEVVERLLGGGGLDLRQLFVRNRTDWSVKKKKK